MQNVAVSLTSIATGDIERPRDAVNAWRSMMPRPVSAASTCGTWASSSAVPFRTARKKDARNCSSSCRIVSILGASRSMRVCDALGTPIAPSHSRSAPNLRTETLKASGCALSHSERPCDESSSSSRSASTLRRSTGRGVCSSLGVRTISLPMSSSVMPIVASNSIRVSTVDGESSNDNGASANTRRRRPSLMLSRSEYQLILASSVAGAATSNLGAAAMLSRTSASVALRREPSHSARALSSSASRSRSAGT
mmetsp:Transcript_29065/g.68013  ORF Transcript_29065/g.68013 Transcript_29065/m.68013 type:complete len:253 (-) Transcript_29065:522-1280(-)